MNNIMDDIYEITVATSNAQSDDCESASLLVIEELKEMKTGFAVCWLWHEVLFGKIENGSLVFPVGRTPNLDRDLREMRLFNKDRELYLFRTEKGFRFRRRIDGNGEQAEYIEVQQILWGTADVVQGGWTTLSERRGIRLTVPIEARGVDEKHRVVLVTRNYITESGIGQAGITDCRFVDLAFGGKGA